MTVNRWSIGSSPIWGVLENDGVVYRNGLLNHRICGYNNFIRDMFKKTNF